MSRSIPFLGPPPPDVRVRPTFDTGDWSTLDDMFALNNFPWNSKIVTDGSPVNAAEGEVPARLPRSDGTLGDIKFIRNYGERSQIAINEEDQGYVDAAFLTKHGLPSLTRVVDGVLEMDCIPTPASVEDDVLRSNMSDYPIVAVDEAGGTITVSGLRWDAREPSIDGTTYLRGSEYVGFDRVRREELVGDPHHFAGKRKQFPYAFALLKVTGVSDREFRYTAVENRLADGTVSTSDPELGPGDVYLGTTTPYRDAPTTHVLTVEPGSIPAGSWPSVGDKIKPQPRLPWIAPMYSTQSRFAQNGGVFESELKIDDHLRQFFAIFFWSNYGRSSGGDGFQLVNPPKQATDDSEIDFVECPGGDLNSFLRHFHNIHAPVTGGMIDHARTTGRPSVMPLTEWDENTKQQHLCTIRKTLTDGSVNPEFVSYTQDFFKIRLYWWPHGNPYGKPGNSVEWMIDVPGLGWRRIGGALSPPWTAEGEAFSPKVIFMNNAVWGDFCRGNTFQFDRNGNSSNDGDIITNRVKSMKVYQFVGHEAGGSALPDAAGLYPFGFEPTPGDFSGGSGAGIVQDADAITLAGGGTGPAPVLDTTADAIAMAPSATADVMVIHDAPVATTYLTGGSSNADVVRVIRTAPDTLYLESLAAGTATVTAYATGPSGLVGSRSIEVTVGGGAPPVDPPDDPPVLTLPGVVPSIDVGQLSDILIDVTDETRSGVTVSASASPAGIVSIESASVDAIGVRGLAAGIATITVTATDTASQSATGSFDMSVTAVAVQVLAAPRVALSRPTETVVRLDITPEDADVTEHEIRRNGSLITTLAMPTTQYDDEGTTAGTRQYAVRSRTLDRTSGDTIEAVTLAASTTSTPTTPSAPGTPLPYLEAFAPRGAATTGGTTSLAPLTARVEATESALGSVHDQPLIVFATLAERDAYPDVFAGLRATTISGNTWAIHTGSAWEPSTRDAVLARVDGGQVYGTPPSGTDAEKSIIRAHLDIEGRVLRYVPLRAYTPS